jgi:hypothetical protein
MSSSRVVPDDAKDQFWAVVEDCLREFHAMKQEAIRRKAGKLRNAIERSPTAELEFFYHSEPFDVACEIADNPLNVEAYLDRYLRVRDQKHGNGISKQKAQGRRNVNIKE